MDRLTRFVLAPLCVLAGLWLVALPFAFAMLSFGDRAAPPSWAEYLGEVVAHGLAALCLGAALTIGGLYLAVTRPSPRREESPNRAR